MSSVATAECVEQYWREVRMLRAEEARTLHQLAALEGQLEQQHQRLREIREKLLKTHKLIEETS
ncbi:hypothetical protein ACF8OH_26910 [Delftia sp. WSY_9]|uniref:hypothetical protein n=1 Tax=unclassified Delftia TaxID=2613839 RepID=UPI00370CCF7A